MTLLSAVLANPVVDAAIRIAGLALLAFSITALATFFYRVRTRTILPEGAALILGLGIVAIYLNTRLIFIQFLGDAGDPLNAGNAMRNVAVFVVAGVASYGGRYAGDRAGLSEVIPWARLTPDFSPVVRATGRFITVTLPGEIADIEGYDPVTEVTKQALGGRELDFPRGLTVTALESQLIARLKEQHEIGHVDLDFTDDGTVEYLAVGQRSAGLGPTLPPKLAAVAVRADPPFSARPGDTIQLWSQEGDAPERVGQGELRASVGNVATVVMDEPTARQVGPAREYRLFTLPEESHPDREFAAMLHRAEETMAMVEVESDGPLAGSTVGRLGVTVIAIRAGDGTVDTIPGRERVLSAGDRLYAIGRPDSLRRVGMTEDGYSPAD